MKNKLNNIFTSWRHIESEKGKTLTESLNNLNKKFDTSYQTGRFRKWELGDQFPKKEILDFILNEVLRFNLKKEGLSAKVINKILITCSFPENK